MSKFVRFGEVLVLSFVIFSGCGFVGRKCVKHTDKNIYPITFIRAGDDEKINKSGLPLEISIKKITTCHYDFNQKRYIESFSIKYGKIETGVLKNLRKKIIVKEVGPVYFREKNALLPIYPSEDYDDPLMGVIVIWLPATIEKVFIAGEEEKNLILDFDISKASLESLIYVDDEELRVQYKQLGKE